MIDSHCHLNFNSLKTNISQIVLNAKNNNISSILTINTDPDEFFEHYDLIKNYQSIFISYGLHPQNVSDKKSISKELIISNSFLEKVIGIGETGLDFFHSTNYKKEQYKNFENHIEASIKTKLPIIVHQRNSENEIIEILSYYQKNYDLKVVLHCFTGTNKLKNFCLDNNFFISISGIVTFKNANDLRDVIKDIPLNSLLIETDSPYLSPVPYRGKENEPSYVKYTAEYLSIFYKTSINEISKKTDDNFYKLFSKAIRYNEINI